MDSASLCDFFFATFFEKKVAQKTLEKLRFSLL